MGKVGADDTDLKDMAYRVVADHIRTLTFAITDGAIPANDGRGYVLRRILRRAVRYGQEILGGADGFFTSLVPVVVDTFSAFYPELKAKKPFVMSIIADEESSFVKTLGAGVKHLSKVIGNLKDSTVVPGRDAHFLFSSMGFPLDLTELMAAEKGFTVDKAGFDAMMENDRKISEAAELARKGNSSKDLSMEAEQTAHLANSGVAITNSNSKYDWDVTLPSRVVALYTGKGNNVVNGGFVDSINSDDSFGIVLSDTSFYYESGGQTYDTGVLKIKSSVTGETVDFVVSNCQTYAGYVVHSGRLVAAASVKIGDLAEVCVDYSRRQFIAPNHTMTHVLNFALKSVLITNTTTGDASLLQAAGLCEQKGSLVDEDKARFDFSWNGPLAPEQLEAVERIVNEQISSNLSVYSELVPLNKAMEINCLRAVFGEKYPDPVRVISVGEDISKLLAHPKDENNFKYSVEFCGGTHLKKTADAEGFALIEEAGIAKGIRRITGFTRNGAKEAKQRANSLLERLSLLETMQGSADLSAQYKSLKAEVDAAVISLVDKDQCRKKSNNIFEILKTWNKNNLAAKIERASVVAEALAKEALNMKSDFVVANIDIACDVKVSKKIHELFKGFNANFSVLIVSQDEDNEKVGLFPLCSDLHIKANGLSAKEWNDAIFRAVGSGKGGGKADTANGFVPNPEPNCIDALVSKILAAGNAYVASKK